jgi:hypothetical protein
MSDGSETKGLRERLATGTEDKLGRALSDLLENPLLTGAIGRAFDAREKAAQAQELAMGALNLPSAADIERLTRRLRSLSQRLEGIEDGVDRLNRSLTAPKVEARLSSIEDQLRNLAEKIGEVRKSAPGSRPSSSSSSSSSQPAAAASPRRREAPKRASASKRASAAPKRAGSPKRASAAPKRAGSPKRASAAPKRKGSPKRAASPERKD